jgi:hypothetical protein
MDSDCHSLKRKNVAGLGFLFEMQFNTADIELMQHPFDALFDARVIGAVTGNEFLDDGPKCRRRQ